MLSLHFSAFLIVNQTSWKQEDLSEIIATLGKVHLEEKEAVGTEDVFGQNFSSVTADKEIVRLALPDGHQQKHTVQLLNKRGIQIDDYPSSTGNRRPTTNLEGVTIKVIRPRTCLYRWRMTILIWRYGEILADRPSKLVPSQSRAGIARS